MDEHIPYFTLLEPLLRPGQFKKNFFVGKRVQRADRKLLDMANEILQSPYDVSLSKISYQHRARDYFFLMMVAIGKIPAAGLHLTAVQYVRSVAMKSIRIFVFKDVEDFL